MDVLVNGNPHLTEQPCTIDSLLAELKLDGKFAIEINKNIIPRSEYTSTKIQPGDNIEIVQAIGGG